MGLEFGLLGLIVLGLDIYAIINIVQSRSSTGAMVLWVLFILIFPLLGFIIWLVAGPRSSS